MKPLHALACIVLLMLTTHVMMAQDAMEAKKLHHTVLFQWAENLDMDAQKEVIALFEGLPAKVEGFESVEMAEVTQSSSGFNFVILMVFTSEDAQKIYEAHPDHVRITQIAPPLIAAFGEFDYWK